MRKFSACVIGIWNGILLGLAGYVALAICAWGCDFHPNMAVTLAFYGLSVPLAVLGFHLTYRMIME